MKRLADKPFVLLGVNSDSDREELKHVIQDQQINWRSWWDGGSTEGPIATQWQLVTWPTIYILDADGLIRYKAIEGGPTNTEAVEETIDRLLAELEAKSANR